MVDVLFLPFPLEICNFFLAQGHLPVGGQTSQFGTGDLCL